MSNEDIIGGVVALLCFGLPIGLLCWSVALSVTIEFYRDWKRGR